MALDKQRILHELSSVMNQLQSADCGCMGKLFATPQDNSASVGGNAFSGNSGYTQRNYCHGHCCNSTPQPTFKAPCSGNPYPTNPTNPTDPPTYHCFGRCNPAKLYADTYNYLSGNLMQPVVKEVYNDLNTLTPANTVMNKNPIANETGVAPCITSAQVSSKYQGDPRGLAENQIMGNMTNNTIKPSQMPENFTGMGPQIVNMIMKEDSSKQSNILGQGHPMTGMTSNDPKFSHDQVVNGSRSPQGQIGNKPMMQPSDTNQYGSNINQRNEGMPIKNHFQYSMQNQPNSQQINNNSHSPDPQKSNVHNYYGQHTHGINKFNEIFPGVMQGVGGDLGFDPMAIAVQMNPANQQKAAMDTIQKLMYGNTGSMPPSGNATNATRIPPIAQTNQNINAQQNPSVGEQQATNEQYNQQILPSQQNPTIQGSNGAPVINQHNTEQKNLSQYQDTPHVLNNQPLQAQQQIVNPNSEAVIPDKLSAEETQDFHTAQMKKEQIFPVDTSKFHFHPTVKAQKQYEYNTLGQPVEMLSAKMYRPMEPLLPQTLSPQDEQASSSSPQYSNVKSTVSKTSIMGNRRASRSQLQKVYNQSKGANLVAHQYRHVPGGVSLSEGKLAPQTEVVRQVPLEKVGGDMLANNQNQPDTTNKINEENNQKGDTVTTNKPYGDIIPEKVMPTGKHSRNGIQDMTYPAYSMSSAWSFQRPIRSSYEDTGRNRY